jgi:hypothetical protein
MRVYKCFTKCNKLELEVTMWRFIYFNLLSFSACFLIIACNAPEQPKTDLELCLDAKIGNYTLVTQLDGELTASDCTREGTIPIDYYKFSVAQQTVVTFYLQTNGADFGVRLFDSNEQELSLEPADQYPRKYKRELMAGDYILAVQTNTGNVGKYTLTTSTLEQGFSGCLTLTKLELGTKVDGELTVSDCGGGSPTDYYEFSLPTQDSVAICGGQRIFLYARDGTPRSLSSTIARGGCFFAELAAGTYIVSYSDSAFELPRSYSISVTTTSQGFLYCYDVKSLEFNVTQQGKIDTTDYVWPPYSFECGNVCNGGVDYADYYGFELSERREINVQYDFAGDHPYWQIYDRPYGNKPRTPSTGANSLILEPGNYVLVVGYHYALSEDPPYSPVVELEPYSLTVSLK